MAANFGMQTGPGQKVVGMYDNATGQQIGGGWQGQYGGSMGYRPVTGGSPFQGGYVSQVATRPYGADGSYGATGPMQFAGGNTAYNTVQGMYRGLPNPFMGNPGVLQGTTQGGGGFQPGGGLPNSFTGVGGGGLPTNMSGLLGLQMGENANARAQNQAIFSEAKGNLLGVPGRYNDDPLTMQARSNALNMAQNYQLNPQDAINRASNLVNAGANARAMALQGQLAASGQLGGSGQFAAQDALERQRMAQLADTGANIQTEYGQLNFNRGLQATQQAQGLAGQRSGLDMNVANSFIGNLPQYLPDDYSAYARLLALQGGGIGGASGGFAGGMSGGAAGSPLANIMGLISQNQSGRVAGGNSPFGFTPAGPPQYNPYTSWGFDATGRFDPQSSNQMLGQVPPNWNVNPLSGPGYQYSQAFPSQNFPL